MDLIIAGVDGVVFDIEIALERQLGALPLPFVGMDKSGSAVCEYYQRGECQKGGACPFRHIAGDRTVVCKHWLRGLCKKGDECEFLHEYDMTKMPECFFYSKFNACHNKECPFLHIDPESKLKDCPWYDRGFCRHGPSCRHRHARRVACTNYLSGLCLDGRDCKFIHPRFDIPMPDAAQQMKKSSILCHYCGEAGHKAASCHKMPAEVREQHQFKHFEQNNQQMNRPHHTGDMANLQTPGNRNQMMGHRPLDEVTCYKCGEKGHYANKCPKGHLAFLSNALHDKNNMYGQQQPSMA